MNCSSFKKSGQNFSKKKIQTLLKATKLKEENVFFSNVTNMTIDMK